MDPTKCLTCYCACSALHYLVPNSLWLSFSVRVGWLGVRLGVRFVRSPAGRHDTINCALTMCASSIGCARWTERPLMRLGKGPGGQAGRPRRAAAAAMNLESEGSAAQCNAEFRGSGRRNRDSGLVLWRKTRWLRDAILLREVALLFDRIRSGRVGPSRAGLDYDYGSVATGFDDALLGTRLAPSPCHGLPAIDPRFFSGSSRTRRNYFWRNRQSERERGGRRIRDVAMESGA